MKTSSAKAKGKRLANLVRDKLTEHYSTKAGVVVGDFLSRTSGDTGEDIIMSPLAKLHCPFDIECKNTETASPWAWMKQAKANTKPGRKPLVVFTRNREGDTYAMIRFDDLLELL